MNRIAIVALLPLLTLAAPVAAFSPTHHVAVYDTAGNVVISGNVDSLAWMNGEYTFFDGGNAFRVTAVTFAKALEATGDPLMERYQGNCYAPGGVVLFGGTADKLTVDDGEYTFVALNDGKERRTNADCKFKDLIGPL